MSNYGRLDILTLLKSRESPKGILRLCVSLAVRYAFASRINGSRLIITEGVVFSISEQSSEGSPT